MSLDLSPSLPSLFCSFLSLCLITRGRRPAVPAAVAVSDLFSLTICRFDLLVENVMASRMSEAEKNEKAIRNLLKRAANRRCINCNSLGPQYVCLNFWTFVCTQCSGIHREFTHRVKSVSMSKFTSQEVANLESGGNDRGREIYFKEWDAQRQPLPDSSNVDRLREFIKMVYVGKRFTGERPRGGDREEAHDSRRPNYREDSRSPPYEDRYEDRGRHPYYGQEDRRYDDRAKRPDEMRSPGRFDNRYDRRYDDMRRYRDNNGYENRDMQYSDGYTGRDRRFANERSTLNRNNSSPPPIRPVKEILGEDIPKLRVEDGHQVNGAVRDSDRSNRSQDGRGSRFSSSSSFGSIDGSTPAASSIKKENSSSLIDFLAEHEASTVQQTPVMQQVTADPFGLTSATEPSGSSTGWAAFDTFSTASVNGPLTSLTASSTVSMPATAKTSQVSNLGNSEHFGGMPAHPNVSEQWVGQWPAVTPTGSLLSTSVPALATTSFGSSAVDWASNARLTDQVGGSQPWGVLPAVPGETRPASAFLSQGVNAPGSVATPSVEPRNSSSSSRQELPEDLFTVPQTGLQFPGPSAGAPYPSFGGMGTVAGNFGRPVQSRNPFDIPKDSSISSIKPTIGESTQMYPTVEDKFPGLASLQSALPNLNAGHPPVPGSVQGNLGYQSNIMGPVTTPFPHAGEGLYSSLTNPNALSQTRQVSSGLSMGGSFPSVPQHVTNACFSHATPAILSQGTFGAGATDLFSTQMSGAQAGAVGVNAIFPDQPMQHLTSYGSLGSLNSSPGIDAFPPLQGGSHLVSQNSLPSSLESGSTCLLPCHRFPLQGLWDLLATRLVKLYGGIVAQHKISCPYTGTS